MKWTIFFLIGTLLVIGAEREIHEPPARVQPIAVTNFVIEVGESQTIPGPSSVANFTATLSGDTNGAITEWSFTNSPGLAVFSNRYGLTNQGTFIRPGRYTVVARASKGNYFNEDSLFVFNVDQGITNFNPQIAIDSPANGSTFTSPIDLLLTAVAEDKDGTITKVVWYDGNTPIWTNTTPPFEFTVTNIDIGSHVFAAGAWDNRGATSLSRSVSVTITESTNSPTPPLVQITIPTNGVTFTAPVTFALTANVVDLDGRINTVTFTDDGATLVILTPADLPEDPDTGEIAPYAFTMTPSVGLHTVRAIAVDDTGLTAESVVSFTVLPIPNQTPSVSVTSPANGASLTGPASFTILATASDPDGTVSIVKFFRNGVQTSSTTTAPYTEDVVNLAPGTYQIWAQAVDNSSGVGISSTNTITVTAPPGVPPVVSLTSPSPGQVFSVGSTVTLSANATDDGTIANVIWYASGTAVASDQSSPYTQPWIPSANTYSITAVAIDNLGLSTTSSPPVTITVNPLIPPFVNLTLPTNNSVFVAGSNVALAATATDSDGTVTKVDFMQFQPDVFISSDVSSPYTGTWTNAPAGSYSIVAKAYDSSSLTTISPAVHVTITTAPSDVMVDAGPFPTATLSPYKAYFDSEYITQSNSFNTIAASGNGTQYLNMQIIMDATLNAYDGTKETNYLNRVLVWAETMVSKATLIDNSGKKNWLGSFASPYSGTPMASQIEEFSAASAMSRVARMIMADASLRSTYGTRATTVYNFVRDEILNKNLVTRDLYPEYVTFSRTTTSATSDKPLILLRLLMDLKAVSVVLGNTDNATFTWPQKVVELAEGIKDYNGQEARFIAWQQPGALVWGHGKTWGAYSDFDTATGNRLPFAVIQGNELGQTFTTVQINGLSDLWTKVMWDQQVSAPLIDNFISGANGTYNGKAASVNGTTFDGWFMLGAYNTNALNLAKYIATAVKNGVPNATLTAHNTAVGRTAMAGALVRDVAMTGTPPYATLLGTVSGSGTTGTNWTHVSGPSGFTIVSPGTPQTRILFTTNAVGSHTFRLTVTSASPTVSDDVVVTVLAAPAFGSGVPPQAQPPGTNIFSRRYIFYVFSGSGLAVAAQYSRLTNIIQRGASVGYNGIVVQDGSTMFGLNPGATALTNLAKAKAYANSLGVKFIPYTFNQAEPNGTAPVELREGFPVIDTKFVRSGGTALPVGDPAPVLLNGGFESFSGNQPTGWNGVDDPGVRTFIDTTTKHGGAASVRIVNPTVNPNKGRVSQGLSCVPFRAYKVTAWIKTQTLSPVNLKFNVIGGSNGRQLNSWLGGNQPLTTQDWTPFSCDFNSLDNSSVTFYIMSGSSTTTNSTMFWVDDVTFTEIGLAKTITRPGLPVTVKNYSGSPTYTAGSDYVVGTESLTIPGGSTIPVGASLKVSWFQLGDLENPGQRPTPGSICNPEFFKVVGTNASLVNARVAPDAWMVRANEWRVGNWDPLCGNITMGQYLSNFVVRTEGVINAINPSIERYFWEDMWSPYHNSLVQYQATKGDLHYGWLGFSPNAIAVNWYNPGLTINMKFWDGLDPTYPKPRTRQILSIYYDAGANYTKNVDDWLNMVAQSEKEGMHGDAVIGVMFTTWNTGSDGFPGVYTYLEQTANYIKSKTPNRWGTGPAF